MNNIHKPTTKEIIEIFSVALVSFVGILMTTAVNVNLPQLENSFKVSLSTVQWASTASMLSCAITMMCSAFLDQYFNDKTVFMSSAVVLLISLIICSFTPSFSLFLFGRILDGCSIGICTPLMFNVIPKIVPHRQLGFYMAFGATIVSAGPSLGPTYGGIVNYYLNWRAMFLFVLPITIILAITGMFSIVNRVQINKHLNFDYYGLALIVIAFVTIEMGLNSLIQISILTFIMFVVGIIAIYLFFKHGKSNHNSLLNIRVFKYSKYSHHVLAYFMVQLTNISLAGLLLPTFSQTALGITSLMAGLMLLPGNIVRIIGTPIGGAILDKHGAKLPIYSGLSIMSITFLVLMIFSKHLTITALLIGYIIYIIGFALSFSNILTEGLQSLPTKLQGDGNAIFNAAQVYGGATGVCLLSLIISLANKYSINVTKITAMKSGGQWCFGFLMLVIITAFASEHYGLRNK